MRPIHYSHNDTKAAHPDQRPCPSWCWVGQHPIYGHELDPRTPMVATHSMEATPTVAASLYEADRPRGEGDQYVNMATIEPRLEQAGHGDPVIRVSLRRYENGKQNFEYDHLVLAIADARELVVALEYLVQVAERG